MAGRLLSLDDLRRYAVTRSLFAATNLKRAIARMGFVQADPIRAPARAQDLILRHRVKDYHAGDLERRYESLGIEEDYFVVYGFVTRELHALMHPRPDLKVPAVGNSPWSPAERKKAQLLLEFVAARGKAHPREVEEHFAHGTVRNYWGGSSHATTQMLDALHYRGLLRVTRRAKGIRIYSARQSEPVLVDEKECRSQLDALVDAVVNLYAPFPGSSLSYYVRRLRYAVPQWQKEISGALERARKRLIRVRVAGREWYWPNEDSPSRASAPEKVRFLAPFDPLVHDRARFEILWGWAYRFEAYTPQAKRKLGYYALPLLWRDRIVGWANLAMKNGELKSQFGYVPGKLSRDRSFERELELELDRMSTFLEAEG